MKISKKRGNPVVLNVFGKETEREETDGGEQFLSIFCKHVVQKEGGSSKYLLDRNLCTLVV